MYGYYTERDKNEKFGYTDLACERRRVDLDITGIEYKKEIVPAGVIERIKITSPEGAKEIGRPMGIYDTIELARMDVLDSEGIADAQRELADELIYIFNKTNIFPGRILIAGLGNPTLTPDSIGLECARKIRPTLHISEFDRPFFESLVCSEIAICVPGVNATSGLDALVTVRALTKEIKPDAVIAIDALASRSAERLGSTVQISNTGICPGSGLGNSRSKIDEESVGVPVIAIGVPTVIDSRVFSACHDSHKKSSPAMIVSPKEINDIVSAAAEIISGGINQAFGICI